jgi:hypothetical protein
MRGGNYACGKAWYSRRIERGVEGDSIEPSMPAEGLGTSDVGNVLSMPAGRLGIPDV